MKGEVRVIKFKLLGGLVGGFLLLLGLTACQDATATPAGTTATTGGTSAAPAGVTATPGQSTLQTTQAVITTTTGQTINMKLELAKTEQEQETGLMGRTSLPEDGGM